MEPFHTPTRVILLMYCQNIKLTIRSSFQYWFSGRKYNYKYSWNCQFQLVFLSFCFSYVSFACRAFKSMGVVSVIVRLSSLSLPPCLFQSCHSLVVSVRVRFSVSVFTSSLRFLTDFVWIRVSRRRNIRNLRMSVSRGVIRTGFSGPGSWETGSALHHEQEVGERTECGNDTAYLQHDRLFLLV